ncbi:MAG TPA: S8 family peptidase [Herpetosiphonaceae bacterium]
MQRFIVLFTLVGVFAAHTLAFRAAPASLASNTKPDNPAKGKPIPDQYIVVLKNSASAQSVADTIGVKAKHEYKAAIKGFTAKLNANQLEKLRQNPQVDFIEQDQEVQLSTTQYWPSWGLDRIDQRYLPLSDSYSYTSTGAGVTAYIIDSGIEASHWDFGGRAANVYDVFGGNGTDCHGHGTHVAGTVGGAMYGVAKSVQLRGLRVFDCSGYGTWSGAIAAVDWVRLYGQRPAVANLSLGGGYMASMNLAVENLVNSGVVVAVAAGNDYGANACNSSPASANGILTVAASNGDYKADFSSSGPCVELYAPGEDIPSAWLGGSTRTLKGTSMASPHVAGAAARYLQNNPSAAPATVNSWIITNATSNVIYGNPLDTPNKLLFIADESAPPLPPEPTRTPPPPPEPTLAPTQPPECPVRYCDEEPIGGAPDSSLR